MCGARCRKRGAYERFEVAVGRLRWASDEAESVEGRVYASERAGGRAWRVERALFDFGGCAILAVLAGVVTVGVGPATINEKQLNI